MKKTIYLSKTAYRIMGCVLMVLALATTSHAQTMSRQNKLIIQKGIQYQSWMCGDDAPEYPLTQPEISKSVIGRTGRYVRIQLGTTEPIDLAELQVFSGGVNIAQGKTTIQSSTQGSAGSNLAVDGNTDGILSNGSVAETITDRSQIEPWWQVDLGSVVNIDSIKVWRRTDAFLTRLKGAYLFVSNNTYNSNTLASTLAQSGVSRYVVGDRVNYYPLGADLTYTNMAPVYYLQPMYNYTIAQQHPNLQWGLAVFPEGAHTSSIRAPSTFEKTTDFLNSLHKSNIGNLSSICFGDEEPYSTGVQANLAEWYAATKNLYPNVLVHNNQWFNLYSESQLRTYMQAAKPDMLTFDSYYFFSAVSPPASGSYALILQDMMMYRKVALEGYDGTGAQPIIYGGYLQAYNGFGYKRNNTPKPATGMLYTYVPSESEYNVGAYSYMLMGAKWLSVWRLLGYGSGAYAWQDASGNWLPTYYTYSRIGKEVKNLSPHLSRLQTKEIRFIPGQNKASGTVATNAMPVGIAAWSADADPYIKSITATNLVPATNFGLKGDVAIGYFTPVVGIDNTAGVTMAPIEHKNAKYFMLMNGLVKSNTDTGNPTTDTVVGKAVLCKQKIAMTIDFGSYPIDTLYRVNRTTGVVQQMNLTLVSGTQYSLVDTLDGGMADLFYWKNSGKPIVGQNALSIPAAANLYANVSELNGASKFTIESWTKLTNGADWASVYGKSASSTNRIGMQTLANGSVYVLLGNGANTYGYTAAGTITTGQWYHVAVVFDGTQSTNASRLKLYINGVQKTLTFTGTIPVTTGTNTSNLSFYRSDVDEVRIWNTAVSGSNILAWKDKTLGACHPNVANLKLYWQMNDNSNPATAAPGLSTSYTGNITNAIYITDGKAIGSSGCSGGLMATSAKNTLMLINPETAGTTRVYPNPITGNQLLQVDISAENAQNASIEVFDGLGRSIYRNQRKLDKGINHATLDLSSKPVGLYIIKIDNGNEIKQFKVIKN